MDKRTLNEKYAQIGAELIETEDALKYIKDSKATIIYLSSEHEMKNNGKLVRAQCEKIPDKYKWSIPCDFTITVFEPNIEGFSEDQIKILILHELLHVKIGFKDDGSESYSVNPHDIEDFRLIIDRYGLDWDAKIEPKEEQHKWEKID